MALIKKAFVILAHRWMHQVPAGPRFIPDEHENLPCAA